MSNIDDFVQGLAEMSPAGAEAQPVQAADTAPQSQPAQPEQQPEPAQPAPAAQPAPQPQPTAEAAKPEPGYVPIAAVLDERDKRKRLEAELQQYRAQQQQPVQAPSAFDAPDDWAAYQQDQLQRGLLAARFEMSEALCRTIHGEAVDPAKDWAMQQANTVPGFADQWIGQANPLDWAVKQHRQHQLLNQIGDVPDLDQWIEQQAAARGFVRAGAAPAAPPQPMAPTPTRSLASQPSAGGPQTVPTGPLASLETIFPGS